MVGQQGELSLRLYRDSAGLPWGFRLIGGFDYNAPLSVQRVFANTPADGVLQRGDVIVAIDNYDTAQVHHKQAQDIIRQQGLTLLIRVRRGIHLEQTPASIHAANPHQQSHLEVNISPPWRQGQTDCAAAPEDEEVKPKSVNELRRMYTPKKTYGEPAPRSRPKPPVATLPLAPSYQAKSWRKPHTASSTPSLCEPGWTPGSKPSYAATHQPRTRPVHHVSAPSHFSPTHHRMQPTRVTVPTHVEPEAPAWIGTLRSSGGPKPWELREAENLLQQVECAPATNGADGHAAPCDVQPHRPRVQTVQYSATGDAPRYGGQHDPGSYGESDTARVAHLQYNTPLGLYSRSNAQQVLDSQTGGAPGAGTMQITGGAGGKSFDPSKSDLTRMVMAEDMARQGGRRAPQRALPPAMSPSMRALESQMESSAISDF